MYLNIFFVGTLKYKSMASIDASIASCFDCFFSLSSFLSKRKEEREIE